MENIMCIGICRFMSQGYSGYLKIGGIYEIDNVIENEVEFSFAHSDLRCQLKCYSFREEASGRVFYIPYEDYEKSICDASMLDSENLDFWSETIGMLPDESKMIRKFKCIKNGLFSNTVNKHECLRLFAGDIFRTIECVHIEWATDRSPLDLDYIFLRVVGYSYEYIEIVVEEFSDYLVEMVNVGDFNCSLFDNCICTEKNDRLAEFELQDKYCEPTDEFLVSELTY